jgi:hypothetical protein
MATLEWGVLGSDVVAVHCSLEGLAGLANYQHACVTSGSNGLAGQSAGEAGVWGGGGSSGRRVQAGGCRLLVRLQVDAVLHACAAVC